MNESNYKVSVIGLAGIAMTLLVWYQWSWAFILGGNIMAIGLNVLLVIGLVVIGAGMVAWLYYTVAMRQAQVEAERARADKERAKADYERAKAISQTQHVIEVRPGHALFSNQPLTSVQVPALPSGGEASTGSPLVTPHAVWFPKAVNALHLILIGESGAGKSTMARAIVGESQKLGDVAIVDPHGRSSDWFGLKVIGAGRNYGEIDQFFKGTLANMSNRYKDYEKGCNTFTRLTIVIDETTSIAKKCEIWEQFFSDVSCEGRKVEIRLIVLIHGKGVRTLSLEGQGDLRHNLQFIYLGKHAVKQVPSCASMERPAVMELDGVNKVIDTLELPQLIGQNQGIRDEKPILDPVDQAPDEHDKTGLKQAINGLDNDFERVIANLLLSGMPETAIAKHLSGDYNRNKGKVSMVKTKLNGYMAGVAL